MSDETIDDIAAWMCGLAESLGTKRRVNIPTLTVTAWLGLAARIEAAAKRSDAIWVRELIDLKNQVNYWATKCANQELWLKGSNAAAMREALVRMCNPDEACDNFYGPDEMDETCRRCTRNPFDDVEVDGDASCPLLAARAALAAPARNCDRFATAEEAIRAFAEKWDGDDHPDFGLFGRWLFAPAEGNGHA